MHVRFPPLHRQKLIGHFATSFRHSVRPQQGGMHLIFNAGSGCGLPMIRCSIAPHGSRLDGSINWSSTVSRTQCMLNYFGLTAPRMARRSERGSGAFRPVAVIPLLWQIMRMSGAPKVEQGVLRARWVRWLFPCAAAAFFLRSIFRDGLTTYNVCSTAFLLVWMLTAWFVVMRTRRPERSFYAVGLASVMVAAPFIVEPAASGVPLSLRSSRGSA
jgi:hypothetical protein